MIYRIRDITKLPFSTTIFSHDLCTQKRKKITQPINISDPPCLDEHLNYFSTTQLGHPENPEILICDKNVIRM